MYKTPHQVPYFRYSIYNTIKCVFCYGSLSLQQYVNTCQLPLREHKGWNLHVSAVVAAVTFPLGNLRRGLSPQRVHIHQHHSMSSITYQPSHLEEHLRIRI